ncbi:protein MICRORCHIDIA 7-like isoform X1 [Pyrus x bretschneideri]|uniref:protein MICRORCHIDIA 7-like isoform X1 n=1 Tax=Pyrus x bretschneideri TaxID=225117 RepID=UPI00202F0854|nr:protein MICRORCHIDIA 7-like isoform X1 [Pyrus x bretschneideri]
MDARVKQELLEASYIPTPKRSGVSCKLPPDSVICLSTSSDSSSGDSDSDDSVDGGGGASGVLTKKRKLDGLGVRFPVGFLRPLPPEEVGQLLPGPDAAVARREERGVMSRSHFKQFWKAGDYEGAPCGDWDSSAGGIDHVRVHPKFLHSNATSHKWALGAFAELLDNALDEVCSGATYVNIDMLENKKDRSRMLLIEDNGGGMDPDKMRHCLSLGYSAKSKVANTIGQYGNGFKTSTMRLGADVIVFSRSSGKDGKSATQSIGLLSYTFLTSTGKEDIVVPMLDYERGQGAWNKMLRSSSIDWDKNLETIIQWSPFFDEEELLHQFYMMKTHGTRIIIYNLWEDDEGQLELDFEADPHDIQIRGVNRDEKSIQMAKDHPNSRFFLTYQHSLRSYVSILYLRIPHNFRIILRGKDVEHHNIVNDMMMSQQVTYRPQPGADGVTKDSNMVAVVTIGFVKDAKHHIDVQGFNVYHKNRLIKPFWRLWNAAGSDGRGVIGLLEANFVEPAHDKQGFERTTVLQRLEGKLIAMQKTYWRDNCHKIGYAPRNKNGSADKEGPPYETNGNTSGSKKPVNVSSKLRFKASKNISTYHGHVNVHMSDKATNRVQSPTKSGEGSSSSSEPSSPSAVNVTNKQVNGSSSKAFSAKKYSGKGIPVTRLSSCMDGTQSQQDYSTRGGTGLHTPSSKSKQGNDANGDSGVLEQLRKENRELKQRLEAEKDRATSADLEQDLQREKDRSKLLETQVQTAQEKIEEMSREQETLIRIFSEERERRDNEEATLRKKLQDASSTIQLLLEKVRELEAKKSGNLKSKR